MNSSTIYHSSIIKKQTQFHIKTNKIFIIKQQSQNHIQSKLLVNQYIPLFNTHNLILSYLLHNPKINNIKTIYLIYQNNHHNTQSIYSLFTINHKNNQFFTGKSAILNFNHKPLSINSLSHHMIIQTQSQLYLIIQTSQSDFQVKIYTQYRFYGKIRSQSNKQPTSNKLFAISTHNNNIKSINNHKIILQIIYKKQQLYFQQIQNQFIQSAIQIFTSKDKILYALNKKLQFYHLRKNNSLITQNLVTNITSAHLKNNPFFNILFINKTVGLNQEKFILTSQNIITSFDRYKHGIHLEYSKIFIQKSTVIFSSPLIGTIGLTFKLKGKQFKIQNSKIIKPNLDQTEQSLFIKGDYQITSLKFLYKNQVKFVTQLFDNICAWANHGIVIGNLLALAFGQQLHFFNISDKFKRIFIHCFDSQISCLTCLNDVNVIGCQLWDNSQMNVMLIRQQKLQCSKKIVMGKDQPISFNINVNTVPYVCTFINGKLLFCSNEQFHRNNPDRVVIQIFNIPYFPQCKLCPVIQSDQKCSSFFLYNKITNFARLLTFNNLNLVKNLQQIVFQYEQILALQLFQSKYMFAIKQNQQLVLFGEQEIYICIVQSGKVKVRNNNLENWASVQQNKVKIDNLKQLNLGNQLQIKCIPFGTDRILIYNSNQLWLCSLKINKSLNVQVQKISYFGMSNQVVTNFRNNLTVNELNNGDFMQLFSSKMKILSVKYVNKNAIFVLYENLISVIQIGQNEALVVRQQLKFNENNDIKIVQLLDSFDGTGIFMKDNQGRLFILKQISIKNIIQNQDGKRKQYKIQFSENLDDDVICVGRVDKWNSKSRKMKLLMYNENDIENQLIDIKNQNYQRMIVRKDGQMSIGQSNKFIYL